MTDHEPLLQAIRDNPGDALVRLVYADWLEEQEQADRAEFVRLQCQDPVALAGGWRTFTAREQELLRRNRRAWLGVFLDHKIPFNYRGGLVEYIWVNSQVFLEEAEQIFATAPSLYSVHFMPLSGNLTELTQSPWLGKLTHLSLGGNNIGDRGALLLAESSYVQQLTRLDLRCTGVGDVGVFALSRSVSLGHLTHLSLEYDHITAAGAEALCASSTLTALQTVDLRFNGIGEKGVQALRGRFGAGGVCGYH
jgi:uncharacterized protein (TIGR02996 family)